MRHNLTLLLFRPSGTSLCVPNLFHAIHSGSLGEVRRILKDSPNLVYSCWKGETTTRAAGANGDAAMLRYLREIRLAQSHPDEERLKTLPVNELRLVGEIALKRVRAVEVGSVMMDRAVEVRRQLQSVSSLAGMGPVSLVGSTYMLGNVVSDLDFVVSDGVHPSGRWTEGECLHHFANVLCSFGVPRSSLLCLQNARVPLVRHRSKDKFRNFPTRPERALTVSYPGLHVSLSSLSSLVEQLPQAKEEKDPVNAVETGNVKEKDFSPLNKVRAFMAWLVGEQTSPSSPKSASLPLSVENLDDQQKLDLHRRNFHFLIQTIFSPLSLTKNEGPTSTLTFTVATPTKMISALSHLLPIDEQTHPSDVAEMHCADYDLCLRPSPGLQGGHLLRLYLQSNSLARVGYIVVHDWAKSVGIQDSLHGYLSSYAITICWVYFLVRKAKLVPFVDPGSVPELQDLQGQDVPYTPLMEDTCTTSTVEIGRLLADFFTFYGREFDWHEEVVTLARSDVVLKNDWLFEGYLENKPDNSGVDIVNHFLCIENPFDSSKHRNLAGHLVKMEATRVRWEFYRMMKGMMGGEKWHESLYVKSQ